MTPRIALVGDYSPEVIAHQAIPRALALAAAAEQLSVAWDWMHTSTLRDPARDFSTHAALWVVPASPYANMAGVLAAIRWARESRRPLLGSCGGFQHLLVEYARSCAGLAAADHAETNPGGAELVATPLACSLEGQSGRLHFTEGSGMRACYGAASATEGYNCRYGLNHDYRARLEKAGLRFTAFDENGEIRGAEVPESVHPFFMGTLFQSERAALRDDIPPLARALVRAAHA